MTVKSYFFVQELDITTA